MSRISHLPFTLLTLLTLIVLFYSCAHWLRRSHSSRELTSVLAELESRSVSDYAVETFDHLTLLGLKAERQLEVYGVKQGGPPELLVSFPFTGFSGRLGPKLREGDLQIPEGIYTVEYLNPNSRYHLSFKLNYPNEFDREMGKRDGRENLGFDIFIHGKSGTVGCIPIGDDAIEELFLMVAKIGIENVSVIIAPHDFRKGRPNPEIKEINWETELYHGIRSALSSLAKMPKG
ncbi:hypothetical protein P0Y35_08380 [Kiritimatiellaeota bacterium B1221]|nr:hypothetical protein [Kiritimatiellaeota bacterium B1221]